MLDASAAVWMPAHIDDAELVHRANAEAVGKLEWSQATWRDDGARHTEAERDRGEQESPCGVNEEERHSRQSETKPYGSRPSELHEAVESASPMTTAP